ncbi:hypothetical protein MSC49_16510 [Methylosinus sp. C49]|uniref:hypothetical protein n=1 Tax=Methylosinus sp. C49 TaxID=2699395 RepID=UPI001366952E|nr:hypothetical protein [Methylosinus sp. C49]BBU61716.1 hypothetical protein MSC49_16510 [Methylosinus sp. C49]
MSAPKNVGRFTPALAISGVALGFLHMANARTADILVNDAVTALDTNMVSEPKRQKPAPGGFDPTESSGILSRNGPELPLLPI